MENQNTFYRFEKKYMLSPWACHSLRRQLAEEMAEDQYGLHTITSVYFDTDDFGIIRSSVQKPLFKEKLRLRWYGIPKPQDPVFLELKRKYSGMVYKRRVAVRRADADLLLRAQGILLPEGQICKEVDWFIRRYRPEPKILLSYDREALQGKTDLGLRVTFDHNIRWRTGDYSPASGSYGTPLLLQDGVLMEIKSGKNLPVWLTDLLASGKLYPSSFSKYGTWYERIYLQKGNEQHVG